MSANTKIEWTDATWNPVIGCTRVSEGCMNCYAERFAARFPDRFGGVSQMTEHGPRWTGKVLIRTEILDQPLRWRKPRRIFVNSMSDLFHPDVPDEFIDRVFAVMALCPQHTFQILTKRPERLRDYILNLPKRAANTPAPGRRMVPYEDGRICEFLRLALGTGTQIDRRWPLSNVWLGVSVENQRAADERIPLLLQTPAALRFLSCEPLLGPVSLWPWLSNPSLAALEYGKEPPLIDWVIVGGESGPGARPMHPDWVRSIRDQCQAAGVAFHFKQWGEWSAEYDDRKRGPIMVIDRNGKSWNRMPALAPEGSVRLKRVGKKTAGRLLDGRTWDELPVVNQ